MCRDVFNKTVRPYVHEFPIGQQGIGFDRIELDLWADAHIATHSVPKRTNTTPSQLSIDNQHTKRNTQVLRGLNESESAHKQRISDEFYRVLESIRGKPAAKKDRKRLPAKK